jgi:hypothetical protein
MTKVGRRRAGLAVIAVFLVVDGLSVTASVAANREFMAIPYLRCVPLLFWTYCCARQHEPVAALGLAASVGLDHVLRLIPGKLFLLIPVLYLVHLFRRSPHVRCDQFATAESPHGDERSGHYDSIGSDPVAQRPPVVIGPEQVRPAVITTGMFAVVDALVMAMIMGKDPSISNISWYEFMHILVFSRL